MLPSCEDPRWGQLVDCPGRFDFRAMGLRILMQDVARRLSMGPNPAERRVLLGEVQSFFARHEHALEEEIRTLFD